jgi:hypothetical protein
MKKVATIILFLAILLSCDAPPVNYYRVIIKTYAGQIIYDETGPEYHVNIDRGLFSNGAIAIKVVKGYSTSISTDQGVIFSVTGNNLIVTHEFIRSEKR